jgi:hypothetical protein
VSYGRKELIFVLSVFILKSPRRDRPAGTLSAAAYPEGICVPQFSWLHRHSCSGVQLDKGLAGLTL